MRAAFAFVATVLAASCGFSVSASQAPGDGDGGVDGDGAPDAAPGVDTDGDGLDDVVDNCPAIANTAQYNEDGDDRGDACDLCPHRPGTVPGTDADSDGDGIGNQCDPRVGIDRKVLFLGFNTAADMTGWQTRVGTSTWSISGGRMRQTDTAVAPAQIVWTGEALTGTVVVDTVTHLDVVPVNGNTLLAAATAAYDDIAAVPDLYACGLRATNPGELATSSAWHFSNSTTVGSIASIATTRAFAAGTEAFAHLVVTDQNPNSTLDCNTAGVPASLPVTGYYPIGFAGFRTRSDAASFDYIFVVRVGP